MNGKSVAEHTELCFRIRQDMLYRESNSTDDAAEKEIEAAYTKIKSEIPEHLKGGLIALSDAQNRLRIESNAAFYKHGFMDAAMLFRQLFMR